MEAVKASLEEELCFGMEVLILGGSGKVVFPASAKQGLVDTVRTNIKAAKVLGSFLDSPSHIHS